MRNIRGEGKAFLPVHGVLNVSLRAFLSQIFWKAASLDLIFPVDQSPGAVYVGETDVVSVGGDSSFEYNEALAGAGGR